jgi:hypothetical protein
MLERQLTILNLYELKGTPEEFERAVRALAKRVEAEGHPGLLSYRFFVNAPESRARAVVEYEGPDAWIGHHELSMGWPEMRALHAAASLEEVSFFGPLTPEIKEWIERSTLTARIRSGNRFIGGFRRVERRKEQ